MMLFLAFLLYPSPDDWVSDGDGYENALMSSHIFVFFFVLILGMGCYPLWEVVTLVRQPELMELGCCAGCCDRERRKERVREDVEQWSMEQFGAR